MTLEEKFLSAYDECAPAILRHVSFRVSDRKTAEDIAQETFLKAWRYAAAGKEIENMRAFFYKIADNLIIDHYRQKPRAAISLEEISERPSEEAGPEKRAEKSLLGQLIETHLSQIDDERRKIILYRYVDGLSAKEIGRLTGKAPGHVNVIIHREIKALKEKLCHV